MMNNKKWIFVMSGVLAVVVLYFLINNETKSYTSHTFGSFHVEEKGHHIEPGKYMEMWVVGYNSEENEENRKQYKVYIKDANVFNLIEESRNYLMSFTNEESLDRYYVQQISPPNSENLTGEGR